MAYPMGPLPTEAQDDECVETIHQEGIEDPWNGCPGCRSPSQLWKMNEHDKKNRVRWWYLWLIFANFAARNTPQQQLDVVEVVLGLVFE